MILPLAFIVIIGTIIIVSIIVGVIISVSLKNNSDASALDKKVDSVSNEKDSSDVSEVKKGYFDK